MKILHKWKFYEKALHEWKFCTSESSVKVLHEWKFCTSESSAPIKFYTSESSLCVKWVKVLHELKWVKDLHECSMKVLHQWKFSMREMRESSTWVKFLWKFCTSESTAWVKWVKALHEHSVKVMHQWKFLHEWNEGKLYVSESSMKVLHQWKYCMCQMSESSAWVKGVKALHEWKEWKFCMSERSESSAWVKVVCSQYCMATCMCTSESFQFLVSRGVCKNPFKDHSRKTPILYSFWNISLHISCT